MESSKVMMNVRRKCFIPGAMFGSFSFINIHSGNKELFDDHGIKNMLEVAVTFRILQLLYKECASSKQKISIAVLSPYPAQVECMQQKLENHYQNDKFFKVNVECSHNYEGGQVDVVIISTGGVHEDECIDLSTSTPQYSNVYLKWARHCLWILGDEKMQSAGSIWESLILDAKARQCFFHANEHKDLAKVIVEVNKDLHQLDELLSGETTLFRSTAWKVLFSSNFRSSFSKIESWETKKLVLLMLLKLSTGWRPKRSSTAASVAKSPYSELMKEFKVRGLHLICTIDIGKETHYTQVLKVWDILPFHKIAELVQRLEGIIGMYTQEYIGCCKARCGAQRGLEFPMKWPLMSTISQYKSQANRCDEVFMDGANGNSFVENVNVSESLMLMKFYSLSSGAVNNMISGCDGEAIGFPFELTEQEKDVVSFDKSSFILGRSGTGKTTVLTMKLFQNEQLHHLACEGFHEAMDETNEENQRYNSTPDMIKFLQFPWSFSNLIDVVVACYDKLSNRKMIFQCNESCLKLQNVEKPDATQEIEEPHVAFEVLDGTNDDLISKVQSDVIFSKLKEVSIMNELYQPTMILSNLTKVSFSCCYVLEHVFCYCMIGSLGQLQELHIENCHQLEVIVKEGQISESKANEIPFPSLKSLKLHSLRSLKGFFLGRETFQWPSLDTLEIKNCPEITVFTNGQSTTNKLKVIDTSFGLCEATEDLNSFIMTKRQEGYKL